jgi:hypothetical protein
MNILEIPELQYISSAVCLVMLAVLAKLLYHKFTTNDGCPNCGSNHDLDRIRKVEILNNIPLMKIKHFKCYKCNNTHYNVALKKEFNMTRNRVS